MSLVRSLATVPLLSALVLTGSSETCANAGTPSADIHISLVIKGECTANTEQAIFSVSCSRPDIWYLIRDLRPDEGRGYAPHDGGRQSRPEGSDLYLEIVF